MPIDYAVEAARYDATRGGEERAESPQRRSPTCTRRAGRRHWPASSRSGTRRWTASCSATVDLRPRRSSRPATLLASRSSPKPSSSPTPGWPTGTGLLPLLRRALEGGRLVVVASDAARYPTTGEVMIGAVAAAIVLFVRTFAREVARDGVRANVITVTLTRDTLTYDRVLNSSDFSRRLFEKAEARMPLGPVCANDIAATIVHLLSAGAATVTSQVVVITGGLST